MARFFLFQNKTSFPDPVRVTLTPSPVLREKDENKDKRSIVLFISSKYILLSTGATIDVMRKFCEH